MKTIVAILLLAATGAALAETGKPADQSITVYKAGKPYIFDGLRRVAPRCPAQSAAESCQAPSEASKPEEKKPVLKAVG
jgi:hypothetical protein